MRPTLFDSSVYIGALRSGDQDLLALRRLESGSIVWLSAVVLQELYAGTWGRGRDVVARVERDFDRAGRILVPNLTDWTDAGDVLARVAIKYGYEKIGQGRLANDALIATSSARMGIRIVTTNEKDFRKLAEFRAFELEITAF
jgi:predicted nucleic acid-binding protein